MLADITLAITSTLAWFAFGAGLGLILLALGEGSILSALLIGGAIGGLNLLAHSIDMVDGRRHGWYT